MELDEHIEVVPGCLKQGAVFRSAVSLIVCSRCNASQRFAEGPVLLLACPGPEYVRLFRDKCYQDAGGE